MGSNTGGRYPDLLAMIGLGAGGEFDLIRSFLRDVRNTNSSIQLGAGDDCAIIPPFAISTDISLENVHFRRDWLQPEEIGYRAAAAALSDLAAVAAAPVAALVSFAFESADANGWSQSVMKGAIEAIENSNAVLAGGDVARSQSGAVIDVTVIGRVGVPVLRSGAKPADEIWVTGTLGGAAAAVASWKAGRHPEAELRECFARPQPRTREALWLAEKVSLNALIDISDGISGDARHVAAASGCRLNIDAARLPVHQGATLQQALSGGEDYELCICAPKGEVAKVEQAFRDTFGIALTHVGQAEAGYDVVLLNAQVDPTAFDHFGDATR